MKNMDLENQVKMKVKILIIVVVAFFHSSSFAQNKVKEREIVLNVEKCKIYGTLKVPKTKEKVPVALIIVGSGGSDRNGNESSVKSNIYKMLSDSLNKYGIATLCYDKRGVAKSSNNLMENELRFEHYIDDAKGWIELLSQDDRFSEVIVIGHSEGSLIGMIACQNNPKASKFISLAGGGRCIDEILKEQLSPKLLGQQGIRNKIWHYIDELKQGKLLENVPTDLYSLFRPSVQPYWISVFKYNPQEEIAKLTIPVLILQGDLDVQISELDAELLHESYPAAKKVIIENMDHTLKNSESTDIEEQFKNNYTNPNSEISTELVKEIVDFVLSA